MPRRLLALALLWPLAGMALEVAPEAATGRAERPVAHAARHMVVAAHPLAAAAGRDILRAGGSAVDAAIATALVLGLVEPQSSGLGGGGFLLHYAKGGAVTAYDGRETAPAAARPDRFLGPGGTPLDFYDAVVGGGSVGVPGMARLMELAHARHGTLPWARLFEPALRLAEDGFPVSERLHALLAGDRYLARDPAARALYYPGGRPVAVGETLRNRAYADTLRLLAREGAGAFYRGAFAHALAGAAADMTAADLAAYAAKERPPVCRAYRVWLVCGMGPPSSGGVAVAQMLAILEPLDLAAMGGQTEAFAHAFAEAGRLAFADRARYGADPDVVPVPVAGLLDAEYLRRRAALVRPDRSLGTAPAGEVGPRWGEPQGMDIPGTTHLSVVDAEGNAVALTASIENSFGARIMVGGVLLNNQLTDFSFRPSQDGRPVANRVEGGKRPLSAMAPTLVLDRSGRLVAVAGSPGGSFIINFVAKALVAMLDWRMDPQQAAALPNLGSRNGPTVLEAGTAAEALRPGLEARGHDVRVTELTSGLHAILVTPAGLLGGADPRREGTAAGD